MRFWAGVIGLLFACLAQAHERSESTSNWTFVDHELHGVVTARTREVTRLTVPGDGYASLPQIFAAHVGRSISASVDGVACTPHQAPTILDSEPGYVRVDVRMQCGAAPPRHTANRLTLKVDLLFGVAPSHHHFLYVAAGSSSREVILSASDPLAEIELRPSGGEQFRFLQFIRMGIEHIATGIDHLAFLLALLIAARTARQVLVIVTGFTMGHSITLSLAVLGVVQANRGAVECLIGLTIALAAAQNLIRGEREGRTAALAATAIAASLLLIPAQLRPDLPASLILAIAVTTGSAVWLASMRDSRGAVGAGDIGRRVISAGASGVTGAVQAIDASRAGLLASAREPIATALTGGLAAAGTQASISIPARFAMAAGFGLIHGLGFASALQDLHLPRAMLLASLLGFNVGVEVGQLAVVLAAVIAITVATKVVIVTQRRIEMSAVVASAALLAAGLAWFLTRAY